MKKHIAVEKLEIQAIKRKNNEHQCKIVLILTYEEVRLPLALTVFFNIVNKYNFLLQNFSFKNFCPNIIDRRFLNFG